MNVVIMAMAPWAKLMTFVARNMSTRASASAAKIMPWVRPSSVMLMKRLILSPQKPR